MNPPPPASCPRIVIVGAGQAGGTLAKALRDSGHIAHVVLVGAERHLPYERPPLSKELLAGTRTLDACYLWRDAGPPPGLECRLQRTAVTIDRVAHALTLDDGTRIDYDQLVLATGGRPRRLAIDGAQHAQYLRDFEDCAALSVTLQSARRVVIIGGGWLGLELAATARGLGVAVVVIETLPQLCARVVPAEIAARLLALHQGHGVDIRLSTDVLRIERVGERRVCVLADGSAIESDAVIACIGMLPNVELARDAGIAVGNGIVVDRRGCTSDADVYAIGDVAFAQHAMAGRGARVESWSNANRQAAALAAVLAGAEAAPTDVPWFWSDQYDVNLQVLGMPERWSEPVMRGDVGAMRGSAFYLGGDGTLEAVIAINTPRDIAVSRRLMARKLKPDRTLLADGSKRLDALLK